MIMEFMLAHIIKSKEKYNTSVNAIESDFDFNDDAIAIVHEFIKVSFDNCWSKFDEYYKIFDLSPTYATVVVLHPAYK
jgi:hypothetical protein